MAKRISENEIIKPALSLINSTPDITTTMLISELGKVLEPKGEDLKILKNRNDTKFSQKVRNLKSHRSTNGMEILTDYNNGKYRITDEGQKYLNS